MSYKKTITDTILPAIAKMIEIEKGHLKTLERIQRNSATYKYTNTMPPSYTKALEESTAFLEMLKHRQMSYENIAQILKD